MARTVKRQAKARAKTSTKAKAARTQKRAGASKALRPRARVARRPAARGQGMQSVAVGFTVNDAAASIKWYCDVLGFSVAQRWEEEGTFLGATLVQGGATINIGQDDWKQGRDRKKGQGVRIFITTADDVDVYAKAIASRGGALDGEPKEDWGFRAFAISDPDGYKITFMRPIK